MRSPAKPAKRYLPMLQEQRARAFGLLHASNKHLERLSREHTEAATAAADELACRTAQRMGSTKIRHRTAADMTAREALARLRGDPSVSVVLSVRCPICTNIGSSHQVNVPWRGFGAFAVTVETRRVGDPGRFVVSEQYVQSECEHFVLRAGAVSHKSGGR